MDNIKVYSPDRTETGRQIEVVKNLSDNIRMEFRFEKCAFVSGCDDSIGLVNKVRSIGLMKKVRKIKLTTDEVSSSHRSFLHDSV
ncbi:hypothetical protein Avbf_06993 [Armadillidium vulgare]|nr:hypothetical protein Avbf_06993 [Armadillidium vulgare]